MPFIHFSNKNFFSVGTINYFENVHDHFVSKLIRKIHFWSSLNNVLNQADDDEAIFKASGVQSSAKRSWGTGATR